ncbi:hypothetical protein AB0N09_21675 [Streptomyces erythrochromogenes]|uniref:hypothetical protein n=1 Tax=Streptomyces erythrochromogenes TaxID=285574 RepID=UPI0034454C7C
MATAPRPNDVLRAAERAYTGLPITLGEPADAENRPFSYDDGAVTITGTARLSGPTVRLTRLELHPNDPAGALSAAQVKGVPFGRIVGSLQTLFALEEARRGGALPPPPQPSASPEEPGRPRRGGRPLITDDLLRQLADAYLEETAEGKPAGALRRVATRFDRPTETIRTWLARARKEGWLAPAVRGRAGGEPGPKLLVHRMAAASGFAAPEVGVHIPEDETDAQREAREQRMHDSVERGGKLWEELRRTDR